MAIPGASATNVTVMQVDGQTETVGGTSVITLIRDQNGKVLICAGTNIPTGAGYSKAALFLKTDVAAGTGGLYLNKGDTTTADFTLVTQS